MASSRDTVYIPKRNLIKARAFTIIGLIVIFAGILLHYTGLMEKYVIHITVGIGVLSIRKGKQYSVERGGEILEKDLRQPIVYLRTFHDEDLSPTKKQLLKDIFWQNKSEHKRKSLSKYTPYDVDREQRALARIFKKIGPYVALGKPGEKLPELGSFKLYSSNDAWQETILKLLQNSRLVIFSAGKSEALRWELKQTVQNVNPTKLLLILPIRDDIYYDFILWANEIFPCKFPNDYPSRRLVVFTENWTPEYLSMQKTLTNSLQPYFIKNGIEVKESYFESIVEFNDWS